MKKIVILFSFILITVLSTGSFIIYRSYLSSYQNNYQSYVKKEHKHLNSTKILIDSSQLYTNSKTIIWEDKNKEIIIDGILYDIISIISNNNKIELTVISDTQEQEIKKQFALSYELNSTKSSNSPLKIIKQFLAFKFLKNSDNSTNFQSNQYCLSVYTNYLFSIKSIFLSKNTPPPNFLV